VFAVTVLLFTACKPSPPPPPPKGADGQPVWMPPEQSKPPKQDGPRHDPGGEPVSIAKFVSEWQEFGLTEDQIKFKLNEGIDDGHLPPLARASDEEIAAIRKAGGSDDLVEFLQQIELPTSDTPQDESAPASTVPAPAETPAP